MMRLMTVILATVLASPALASSEISAEFGTLYNGDPQFDIFSSLDAIPSGGVRVGYAVHDNVSVIAGYHHGQRGADVYTFSDEEEFDLVLRTAFSANEFTVGAKGEVPVFSWLVPYATAQGMLFHGVMRFDDDPYDRRSPGQVRKAGLGGGGLLTGGLDFRIPQGGAPFTLGLHVEAGYALISNVGFGDYGRIRPGGFVMRTGLGLRF